MKRIDNILSGNELDTFFKNASLELENVMKTFLSEFAPEDTFHKWREFIRHIDELYNITSLTSVEEDEIINNCSIAICSDPRFGEALRIVGKRYGKDVQNRFLLSCQMLSALNLGYYATGQIENFCGTIGEAIDRCQKMRLYYTSFLLLIPKFAKGTREVDFSDLLIEFQPHIDVTLVQLRTAYNARLINKCIDDFIATPTDVGLEFNFVYNHLETESLEPVRMSEVDVMENMTDEEQQNLPHCRVKEICGYQEMLDCMELTSAVFDKYGVNELEEYKEMKHLAQDLQQFVRDNYVFVIPSEEFDVIRCRYPALLLWEDSDNMYDMLNSRPAFFKFEHMYYSTVLLFQRYMVNELQRLLYKKKKFQIDSGFVLEKKVKSILTYFAFDIKEIKRIQRKEFDVIAVKDNVIYNFQCKNNFVNISQQGGYLFKSTYLGLRRLERYYKKALKKEDERALLLKEKLGLETVRSFVISRFPVITRNERIINFNQLPERLAIGL